MSDPWLWLAGLVALPALVIGASAGRGPGVVQGYAADRPAHTQWMAYGSTVAATATQWFHDADTGPGFRLCGGGGRAQQRERGRGDGERVSESEARSHAEYLPQELVAGPTLITKLL